MMMNNAGKYIIAAGVLLVVVGLVVVIGGRFGLGQLPGDVSMRRGNTSFHFPVVSSIIVSVVLTILLNIVLRFFR